MGQQPLAVSTTPYPPIINPIPSATWNSGPLRPLGPPGGTILPGPQVQILLTGHLVRLANGQMYQRSSVTLVQDDNKNILVDTGMGTDVFELVKGEILQKLQHNRINQSINWWILALSQYNLNPDNIDMVVITHGHLDHTGNQNFFAHKIVLFDHLEFLENRFYETTLKKVIVKPL